MILTFSIVLLSALLAVLPHPDSTPQEDYIATYSEIAISEMHRTGVPASITLAQGMLESGNGKSELASAFNNHFGIKCHTDWKGGRTFKDDDTRNECFRVYQTAEESFRDHSDFLRYRERYQFLFDYKTTDYKAWARGLSKAGYATDPRYADKLIGIISEYNLSRFDEKVSVEEPEVLVADLEKMKNISRQFDEVFSFPLERTVYKKNGARFIYSLPGESWKSVAETYHLFPAEIYKYNSVKEDGPIKPGTEVYLSRPRRVKK